MSKLRDPIRFAAFVEGASHLRDEEILHFESSKYSDEEDDDSDISFHDSEEEKEANSRLYNNGRPSVNTIADISEDEDNAEENIYNNLRSRPSLSRHQILTPQNFGSVKPKSRQTTPTVKARQSSSSKTIILSHRVYKEEEEKEEVSDES